MSAKLKRNALVFLLIGVLSAFKYSSASDFQPLVADTLLFTIRLTDDSTSLFYRNWSENIRGALAGPVLMSGNRLLFHSQHGYALYDIGGKLLETHSLIQDNMRAAAAGRPQTFLAYPFDSETVIYYTDTEPATVFRKTLQKRGLVRVGAAEMDMFKDIKQFEPLNIFRGGTTENIGRRNYLRPHLVGFTALEGGSRWWSTDVFFSFTSPMIMETDGRFTSFFPGLREGSGYCEVRVSLITSLGVFAREGRWYYLGVYSDAGDKADEYFQTVVLCDQAGNVLYCSRLLKQGITDVVLRERRGSERAITMRGAGRHVFVPSVDPHGDIFYGLLDRGLKTLEVYKRSFARFLPSPAAPAFGDAFDREGRVTFKPINLECSEAARGGVVPVMHTKNDAGETVLLDVDGLTRDNYYVKIHRLPNEDLRKKTARVSHTMPKEIGAMQDSISKLATTWCPYGISLHHAIHGGPLATLNYGFNDIVVSARVLGVSKSGYVYIRVDLEDWAEIVVFSQVGFFVERFTFNNTHYNSRKDVVVLAPDDVIYERDYEAGLDTRGRPTAGHRFTAWRKGILPLTPPAASAPQRGRR